MHPSITENDHFRSLFENVPTPLLVLKPDPPLFTIAWTNVAYNNATNTTKEAVVGKPVFEVFPENPADIDTENYGVIARSFHAVVDTGESSTIPRVKYDIPIPGATGFEIRYWTIKNTPVHDAAGELLYIIQNPVDVTDVVALEDREKDSMLRAVEKEALLSKMEQASQTTQTTLNYLQAVIDASQTGIFLFNPVLNEQGDVTDFKFIIANHTLSSYVGQEPESVIGALGSRWFPDYKTNGLFDYYADTWRTGNTNRFDFHYDGDGIDSWLDIMSTKIGNDVLVTFSDFTAMKLLQQNMETSVSELKRSNDNLEQFAYVASHDLQEPLRKIKAFGDILMDRHSVHLPPDGIHLIERMQAASERMRSLIEALLNFSQVSFQQNEFQTTDLNAVVKDVLYDLETAVKEKNAVINVHPLYPVSGDVVQLRQVFQNLISNALKFNKKDTVPNISITATQVTGGESAFKLKGAEKRQNFQQIEIIDNGIGFEQQYADKIFQIFQRLHGRVDYPGTGVGLSIVQKVMENHNGYISAEGALGNGATFTLLLPIIHDENVVVRSSVI